MKDSKLELINKEINKELTTKEISRALLSTTFKGFSELTMKQAMMEGMMRGFKFKDFLEKNVYAIPFKDKFGNQTYSLISSIDYARKIAMRSGLAGKSEPKIEYEKDGRIKSCTITVKRNVNGITGDYTATVFFSEYSTGKNLWSSKPHTMIAKVAEMHALRSAFPEEMSKQYVEEEMQKDSPAELQEENKSEYEEKLKSAKTLEELRKIYATMPQALKVGLRPLADQLKKQFNENSKIQRPRKVG